MRVWSVAMLVMGMLLVAIGCSSTTERVSPDDEPVESGRRAGRDA